jgi:F0F1-type ATP synthase delta subunit
MRYTVTQYAQALDGLVAGAPTDEVPARLRRFGIVIRKHGQQKLLPDIMRDWAQRYDQAHGIIRVEVESAGPVDTGELSRQLALDGQVVIVHRLRPELGSGLRIRVRDQLIDNTAARRIGRIKQWVAL